MTLKFSESLVPCDDLYRKQLNEQLNPVPAKQELEAKLKRMFTYEGGGQAEIQWKQDELRAYLDQVFQPIEHFYGRFDE